MFLLKVINVGGGVGEKKHLIDLRARIRNVMRKKQRGAAGVYSRVGQHGLG